MAVFPGLDISSWDARISLLWRWSNLRFCGFYLNHLEHPQHRGSNWVTHLREMVDTGWSVVPIFLPFSDSKILTLMPLQDGAADGRAAVGLADAALLEHGAVIYLDLESQVFSSGVSDGHGGLNGFARYVSSWLTAVRQGGYQPGVYCSFLDVAPNGLLAPEFAPSAPWLWPFAATTKPRGQWDQAHFLLTPADSVHWPVGAHRNWPDQAAVIACQYDQNKASSALTWPTPTGNLATGTGSSRDVDWDAGKVPDPAHPQACAAVALSADRGSPDLLNIYVVRTDVIETSTRAQVPTLVPGRKLGLGLGDIGPAVAGSNNGFDIVAAAVSRRFQCSDVFVLGLDGLLRTLWVSPAEEYPKHPWPLNPRAGDQARRGSPLSAVSRDIDQIDVFYAALDHRLATQWWHPSHPDWATNRRVIDAPLIAGGSTITALPSLNDWRDTGGPGPAVRNRLDVFYVTLDYSRPANPRTQGVVHVRWTPDVDWQATLIPNLTGAAAASGVAAAIGPEGTVHLIVQRSDRCGLIHACLPLGADWVVGTGPILGHVVGPPPDAWMTLHLVALPAAVLLTGTTRLGHFAWASYVAGKWSAIGVRAPRPDARGNPVGLFATRGRLIPARRGPSDVDVFGLDEAGVPVLVSLHVDEHGQAYLATH